MKNFPYDIESLENFNQIKNENLNLFNLKKRRKIWDEITNSLLILKIDDKTIAYEFFTSISFALYNYIIPIISALIDYQFYKNKNVNLVFNNGIINSILKNITNEDLVKKNFIENINIKKTNKIRVILRNIYFLGNFNKPKVDLLDHNFNSRVYLKENFLVKYRPSNNFFNFYEIIKKDYSKSDVFNKIFDELYEKLNLLFIQILKDNYVSNSLIQNFSIFLKFYLKFEINIFLEVQKKLKNIKFNDNISSSIAGFKPSRLITTYNYFKEKKIIKFDHNAGILNGNHKGAYLGELNNCTDYFLTTDEAKIKAEKFYNQFFKTFNNKKRINFHSLQYKKQQIDNNKKKTVTKFKYTYFANSFKGYEFHGNGTFHDLDYLKLQSIIFNFLKKNTNDFFYRAHPETIIGINKNPLEKYLKNITFKESIIDGVICVFDSTISSAFWECLQNQNPIILIRHYLVDESSLYLKRLEERCEIIDIDHPEQTTDILKHLNFKKISQNSVEKSKVQDDFDNVIF